MTYANGNDFEEHNRTVFDLFKKMVVKNSDDICLNPTGDDRYKFNRILGRGATGLVYKAWDKVEKRHVAVKVSNKGVDRFVSETKLVGKLTHDNIVSIYDSNSGPEFSYIIMEYIEGDTLDVFCDIKNLLSLTRVSEVMIDICKGIHFAHDNGVIHRDIKPSNIILNKQGIPKITDLGLSLMINGTQPMGFWGTPSYMSPEQLKGFAATKASDIFSLGCVLYELIEGRKAFEGENPYTTLYKVINEKPAPLSTQSLPVQAIFQPIIKKATAKNVEERYESCRELAYDLSKALPHLSRFEKVYKKTFLGTIKDCIREGLNI
ncbi:MAG: serine/threonine protein kinase [Deltaproteobacteria bacterium]|nr:serine/threonine protein kinase [Deltaproteobacteria bacterium]